MRFLFFDTECANCYDGVGKICEFGYVLTDEKFKVIKSDNLLINPKSKFNVYGFKQAGIVFAHSYSEYLKYPTLKQRYSEIKRLMTDKKNLVVGYSTDCDANYLLGDLKRNGLAPFDFKFLDVAKLYRIGLNQKETSLDNLYEDCDKLDEDITHHEAMSDSFMTMAVLKRYLELTDGTVKNLEKAVPEAFGELFEGRLVIGDTAFRYTKSDRMTQSNKKLLDHFVENCPRNALIPRIVNKSICFSRNYEHTHFAEVLAASKAIITGGGKYCNVISHADIVVYHEDEEFHDIKRMTKRKAKLVKISEFCEMLGLPADALEAKNVNVDLILAYLPENKSWYEKFLKAHKEYAKRIKQFLRTANKIYVR